MGNIQSCCNNRRVSLCGAWNPEAVVFGSGGESVTEGIIVLVAAPALVTSEISTSDAPGEPVRAGMAELVCVPGWVTDEAVVSGSLGETVRV